MATAIRSRIGRPKTGISRAKPVDAITSVVPTAVKLPEVDVEANRITENTLRQYFKKIKQLGQGAYGTVWKVELMRPITAPNGNIIPKGEIVAVKSQAMAGKKFDAAAIEINALRLAMKSNCGGVNQLYDVFYDSDLKVLYFVLELIDGIELFDLQTTNQEFKDLHNAVYYNKDPNDAIPEKVIIDGIINPLLEAFTCLHKHGIAHRDVKAENIMMKEETEAVFIDFGLSCITKCTEDLVGTPETIAPEIYDGSVDPKDVENWINADYWGFGCTLYELIVNETYPPQFDIMNAYMTKKDVKRTVKDYSIKVPELDLIPDKYPKIKRLLSMLLDMNPKKRNPGSRI